MHKESGYQKVFNYFSKKLFNLNFFFLFEANLSVCTFSSMFFLLQSNFFFEIVFPLKYENDRWGTTELHQKGSFKRRKLIILNSVTFVSIWY
jgi:hypothetical protein